MSSQLQNSVRIHCLSCHRGKPFGDTVMSRVVGESCSLGLPDVFRKRDCVMVFLMIYFKDKMELSIQSIIAVFPFKFISAGFYIN